MNLYLVAFTDDEDTNFDLFVSAATPEDTIPLWQAYYGFDGTTDEDAQVRVFEVPESTNQPQAHEWDNPVATITVKL